MSRLKRVWMAQVASIKGECCNALHRFSPGILRDHSNISERRITILLMMNCQGSVSSNFGSSSCHFSSKSARCYSLLQAWEHPRKSYMQTEHWDCLLSEIWHIGGMSVGGDSLIFYEQCLDYTRGPQSITFWLYLSLEDCSTAVFFLVMIGLQWSSVTLNSEIVSDWGGSVNGPT